jgi:hypothetical protein
MEYSTRVGNAGIAPFLLVVKAPAALAKSIMMKPATLFA